MIHLELLQFIHILMQNHMRFLLTPICVFNTRTPCLAPSLCTAPFCCPLPSVPTAAAAMRRVALSEHVRNWRTFLVFAAFGIGCDGVGVGCQSCRHINHNLMISASFVY